MSFIDWLYSNRPATPASDPWGPLHIIVLISCIALIIGLSLIFKNKSEKARYTVIFVIAMGILFFELLRRIINFTREGADFSTWKDIAYTLIPRPWCAISCWVMISSVFVKKKFFYNFAAITSLVNVVIFFAYPEAGFRVNIMFEEVYSIVTHCLLLIGSISLITLGHTDFRYNRGKEKIWYEYLCYAGIFIYAIIEILLGIEKDPMYFMPNNGVISVVPLPYPIYLVVYVIFVFGVWTNAFYLIPMLKNKLKDKNSK